MNLKEMKLDIIRKRKKNISISIRKNLEIKIYVPLRMSTKGIEKFIDENKEWIIENYSKVERRKKINTRKFISGENFLLKGENKTLEIRYYVKKNAKVNLENNKLKVYLNEVNEGNDSRECIQKAIYKWYRKEALKTLTNEIEILSKNIGIPYNSVKIKQLKRRLGSCDAKKNIVLNWKLILAPYNVRRYVIIHELAHTIHMNHSKKFWELVAKLLPDYKKEKAWIRENVEKLDFYNF